MPALPKTSDTEIVEAARQLVEAKGRDGFSMQDVADAVGVRAPSLYGRFKDRATLLQAVELRVCDAFAAALEKAADSRSPEASLVSQALACRRFARENPNSYSMLFDIGAARSDAATAARAKVLGQLMPSLGVMVGETHALEAARVLTPFIHGFISFELANAFRMGGDVDGAYEAGVRVILRGLIQSFPA